MAEDIPGPLTPIDCDLRDFGYMPVDVVWLRDSDVAGIDAVAFKATILLWSAAWHQVPAASLPDDDALLARLAGYGRDVRNWKRAREKGALRGFVLCTDGRLYHPAVARKALEAWRSKQERRERTEAARAARRASQQGGTASTATAPEVHPASTPSPPRVEPHLGPTQLIETAQPAPSVTVPYKGEGEGEGSKEEVQPPSGARAAETAPAPPVVDLHPVLTAFWRSAVPLVQELFPTYGDASRRRYLGKLLKASGDRHQSVLVALAEARTKGVVDPAAWLVKAVALPEGTRVVERNDPVARRRRERMERRGLAPHEPAPPDMGGLIIEGRVVG